MPIFQSAVANITLGNEPTGLRMAIVNDEVDLGVGRVCTNATDCEYSMLSCRYLRYISDNIIQVKYFVRLSGVEWPNYSGNKSRFPTKMSSTLWRLEKEVTSGASSTSAETLLKNSK